MITATKPYRFRRRLNYSPSLTNLLGWYEAGIGLTVDGSNNISQWNDLSGNGNHLTNSGAANTKPIAYINKSGFPVVAFDKNRTATLTIPTSLAVNSRACSMWIVGGRSAGRTGGSYADEMFFGYYGSVTPGFEVTGTAQGPFNSLSINQSGRRIATIKDFNCHVLRGFTSGTVNTVAYQNGKSDGVIGPVPDVDGTGGQIGAFVGDILPLGGPIYSLLLYGKEQTADEIAGVYAYAQGKYQAGFTRDSQVGFAGDSITSSIIAQQGDSYPEMVGRLRGWDFDGINTANGMSTTTSQNTQDVQNLDPAYDATYYTNKRVICLLLGSNDLAGGSSAATVLTNLQTYVTNRQAVGWDVRVGTILDRTDFSGSDRTNQQTVNAAIIANSGSWHDGLIPFATAPQLLDPSDTEFFDDGIHPTVAGNQVMALVCNGVLNGIL
jgi:lysophospholipase L1-like esterase